MEHALIAVELAESSIVLGSEAGRDLGLAELWSLPGRRSCWAVTVAELLSKAGRGACWIVKWWDRGDFWAANSVRSWSFTESWKLVVS